MLLKLRPVHKSKAAGARIWPLNRTQHNADDFDGNDREFYWRERERARKRVSAFLEEQKEEMETEMEKSRGQIQWNNANELRGKQSRGDYPAVEIPPFLTSPAIDPATSTRKSTALTHAHIFWTAIEITVWLTLCHCSLSMYLYSLSMEEGGFRNGGKRRDGRTLRGEWEQS